MPEPSTTSRILRLLSLLQSRRSWTGAELAERTGASGRTVRRDVDRLRELGYSIVAQRGAIGGYRLEAGSDLPPLLFSGDEAVALAVGLRAGIVDGSVRGMGDLITAVLAKLEQVLPAPSRARVRAIQTAVPPVNPVHHRDQVDPETLGILALGCRDSEVLRFDYVASDGRLSTRKVEPTALVPIQRRWYLLAWDLERRDWRTFRVDRITAPVRTHRFVERRSSPEPDAATFVTSRLGGTSEPAFTATVRIHAALPIVTGYIGPFTTGLTAEGEHTTLWRISDDHLEVLAGALTWLPWSFTIVDCPALQEFLAAFVKRASDAV